MSSMLAQVHQAYCIARSRRLVGTISGSCYDTISAVTKLLCSLYGSVSGSYGSARCTWFGVINNTGSVSYITFVLLSFSSWLSRPFTTCSWKITS